jgi:hypothetical protein
MANFAFVRGEYRTAKHTPSGGAVTAGDGVIIGSVTANTAGTGAVLGIAHRDIANNVEGTLAVGGGVYDCVIASNYAAGVKLYKPSGNSILTTTSTNNTQFGYLIEAAAAANAVCEVVHVPYP